MPGNPPVPSTSKPLMRMRHKLHFDECPTIPSQQLARETASFNIDGGDLPQPWDDIEAEYNRLERHPLPMDDPFGEIMDEGDMQDAAFDEPPEEWQPEPPDTEQQHGAGAAITDVRLVTTPPIPT